ncbi:MAG: class I SAM-dependent methyltransferase [Verrucomicrobiota bacterium]
MEIRTVSRPVCPLCRSQGNLLHIDLEDYLFKAPGKWNMRICANLGCGLGWLDPVAIDADLQYLYENYYTHGENTLHLGSKAKLRSFLFNAYEYAKFIPSSILGLRQEKQRFPYLFLEDLSPGHVLDVGCGTGDFLFRMRALGWAVTGVDFDGKAIANAKAKHGFNLLHTDLAGAHFPDNSFDAITMHHVIEHVPEPVALLSEAKRILKPGGRLVVTTPNVQSLGHSILKDCWRGLEPPRHLQIFSLRALSECARQAGFDKVEAKSSAANADAVIGASIGIFEAKKQMTCSRATFEINILRALRCSLLQYREALLIRRNINCGEEALLICHK